MGILILPGRVCIALLITPSGEWGFFLLRISSDSCSAAQEWRHQRSCLLLCRSWDVLAIEWIKALWLLSALTAENPCGFPRSPLALAAPLTCGRAQAACGSWITPLAELPEVLHHGETRPCNFWPWWQPCCFPLLTVEGLKVVEIEKCKRDIKKMREEMAARSSR